MGRVKDWQMQQEERGWWSIPGKFVCADCFEDEDLKQAVQENLETSNCDYCESTAEDLTGDADGLIAAPLDSVMEVIAKGLHSEFNNADDEGIIYETAEGGYQANTLDSYDLVRDYICPANDVLAKDILASLSDQVWVKRHYYSLSEDQALWYGWENFCDLVKHRNRYMFHLRGRTSGSSRSQEQNGTDHAEPPLLGTPTSEGSVQESDIKVIQSPKTVVRYGIPFTIDPNEPDTSEMEKALEDDQEGISASSMLQAIGEAIEQVGLIRELPSSTEFSRARTGPTRKPFHTARSLGPPPPNSATASRMSPAGIPMFYGALERHTAIEEIIHGRLKRGTIISVGRFVTLEGLRALDLTKLEPVPGIFSQQRYLRPVLKFLNAFVHDLSKEIKKDGREHIEYVPTQILTEYFRHSFVCADGKPVQGILYPSARASGGVACVLFVVREECGVIDRDPFKIARKQKLRFVPGSAEVFSRKPRRPK